MRNLKQYPITSDEVNEQLKDIQLDPSKTPIGNLAPMIRNHIKQFFAIDENMNSLLEQMKV